MQRFEMKMPKLNLLKKIHKPGAYIKYVRKDYGMKFYLPENLNENELLQRLARIPPDAYKLPEGQGITLDFMERECSKRLIIHMLNSIVWEKNIKILAWLSKNENTLELFKDAGLNINEPEKKEAQISVSPDKPEQNNNAEIQTHEKKTISALKVVYNSMRSGQRVETDGDVVVWGHLNPGAEVVAGGSVIVAGRLLGVIHAGAYGRNDVFIWAQCFETPQVRIGNKVCYADEKSTSSWRKNVLITLEDGTPVIRENKFILNDKKMTGGF